MPWPGGKKNRPLHVGGRVKRDCKQEKSWKRADKACRHGHSRPKAKVKKKLELTGKKKNRAQQPAKSCTEKFGGNLTEAVAQHIEAFWKKRGGRGGSFPPRAGTRPPKKKQRETGKQRGKRAVKARVGQRQDKKRPNQNDQENPAETTLQKLFQQKSLEEKKGENMGAKGEKNDNNTLFPRLIRGGKPKEKRLNWKGDAGTEVVQGPWTAGGV